MVVKYILWVDKKIKNLVGLSSITKTEHNVKIWPIDLVTFDLQNGDVVVAKQ